MFAFLNGAMVASTQRYLTFELGKENQERLKVILTTGNYIPANYLMFIKFHFNYE